MGMQITGARRYYISCSGAVVARPVASLNLDATRRRLVTTLFAGLVFWANTMIPNSGADMRLALLIDARICIRLGGAKKKKWSINECRTIVNMLKDKLLP